MSSVQSLHHDGLDSAQTITPLSNAFLGLTNQQLTPKLVKIGKVSSEKVFRAGDPVPKKARLSYTREQLIEISKLEISKEKHVALKDNPNAPLRDLTPKAPPLQLQRPNGPFQQLSRAPRDLKDKEIKLKKDTQTVPPGLQKGQFGNNASFNGDRDSISRSFLKDEKNLKTLPVREIPPRRLPRSSRDFDRNDEERKDNRPFLRSRGEDLSNNFASNRQNFFRNGDRNRFDSRKTEEEPEWFTNGPTSQHDVIELNGFESPGPSENDEREQSDERELQKKELDTKKNKPSDSETKSDLNSESLLFKQLKLNDDDKAKEDFDLDEIFKLEWQRTLTEPVSVDRHLDGSDIGSSKFAQWFNRSNSHAPEQLQSNVQFDNQHQQIKSENGDSLNKLFAWNSAQNKNDENEFNTSLHGSALSKTENHLINILKKARINVDDLMQQTQRTGQGNPPIKQQAKSAAEIEANLLQIQGQIQNSAQMIEHEMPKLNSDSELLQRLLRQSNRVKNIQNSFEEQKNILLSQHQQPMYNDATGQFSLQQHLNVPQQHHNQPQNIPLAKLFASAQNVRLTEPERTNNKFNSNVNTFLPTSVIRKIASEKDKPDQFNRFNNNCNNVQAGNFEQFRPSNGNMFMNGISKSAFEQHKWEQELLRNSSSCVNNGTNNRSKVIPSDLQNEYLQFSNNESASTDFGLKRSGSGNSNFYSVPNSKSVSPMNQEMAFIHDLVQGNIAAHSSRRAMNNTVASDLHSSSIPSQNAAMQFAPNVFINNSHQNFPQQQQPQHLQHSQHQQMQRFPAGFPQMNGASSVSQMQQNDFSQPNMKETNQFMQIMAMRQTPVNQFGDMDRMSNFSNSVQSHQMPTQLQAAQSMAMALGHGSKFDQNRPSNHTPLNLHKMFENDLGLSKAQVPIQKAIYLDEIERQ